MQVELCTLVLFLWQFLLARLALPLATAATAGAGAGAEAAVLGPTSLLAISMAGPGPASPRAIIAMAKRTRTARADILWASISNSISCRVMKVLLPVNWLCPRTSANSYSCSESYSPPLRKRSHWHWAGIESILSPHTFVFPRNLKASWSITLDVWVSIILFHGKLFSLLCSQLNWILIF